MQDIAFEVLLSSRSLIVGLDLFAFTLIPRLNLRVRIDSDFPPGIRRLTKLAKLKRVQIALYPDHNQFPSCISAAIINLLDTLVTLREARGIRLDVSALLGCWPEAFVLLTSFLETLPALRSLRSLALAMPKQLAERFDFAGGCTRNAVLVTLRGAMRQAADELCAHGADVYVRWDTVTHLLPSEEDLVRDAPPDDAGRSDESSEEEEEEEED